jgi:hypothetical protein
MSIMGVLCAFSVGVLALALDRILGSDKPTTLTSLWPHQGACIIVGSILVLISALMFYRQRSLLAWYYGQISLSLIEPNVTSRNVEHWLREADSWATWVPYRIGWGCLTLAMWTFVAAIIEAATAPTRLPIAVIWLPILVYTVFEIPHLAVLRKYRYDESPRKQALTAVRKKLGALIGEQS